MTIPVGRKTRRGEYHVDSRVLCISMLRDHAWRLHFALSITANRRLESQLKAAIPNKWGGCTNSPARYHTAGKGNGQNCAASCILCRVSSITTPASCPHHTWRFWDIYKPPPKLSHLLNLTWSCVHIVMEYAFSSKVTQIKYQVTEKQKEEFDLLCHHGAIKISFFQDLRVSPLSWLRARNGWEMWIYVAKSQENITQKGILIYTVNLACLFLSETHTWKIIYWSNDFYANF